MEDVKKSHNVANNVAQRNSQDEELMKKIFPHKEIIEGESVLVFPYIEEASPLKDVPQEVVSKMEKATLTEQWKKGELKTGWYYVKNEFGNIFVSEYSKGYDHINERIEKDFFTEISDIIEIICEVPEYTIWRNYVTGFCDEHEYNLKLQEENQKLKELLEKSKRAITEDIIFNHQGKISNNYNEILSKIDEVLK